MINLSDDNDPMLFAVSLPQGTLILQFMEVAAAIAASQRPDAEPTQADVLAAIRTASRTPDVAGALPDNVLIAAWHRINKAVETAGNV